MDEPNPDKAPRPPFEPSVKRDGPSRGTSFVLGPDGAYVERGGERIVLADPVDMFWSAVAASPAAWVEARKGYDWLVARAATASREDLRRTLNWLSAAIDTRQRPAALAAARYLAQMPRELLQGEYARLLDLLNSRIVGMAWTITPDFDVKPLPPRVPKFGMEAGFGLLRSAPELYEKLAALGPEMEIVVEGLVAEALRYGQSLPPALTSMAPPPAATG